jgi:hypothetical protein
VDLQQVKDTLMQASEICDLIGYRNDVAALTDYGRKPGPSEWHHTIEYMRNFADPANTDKLIDLLKSLGACNEIEAIRAIIRFDRYVP